MWLKKRNFAANLQSHFFHHEIEVFSFATDADSCCCTVGTED